MGMLGTVTDPHEIPPPAWTSLADTCRDTHPRNISPGMSWYCTAADGHPGPHAAYSFDGTLKAVWADGNPATMSPADWCAAHGIAMPEGAR